MINQGQVLTKSGRLEEAEQTIRGALDRRRTALGEEHHNIAVDLYNLGVVLRAAGRDAGARAALGEALALRRRLFGDEHPQTIETLGQLEALGSRPAS